MAARRAEARGVPAPLATPVATPVGHANGHVVRYSSQDGLSLAVRIFGPCATDRLPVICLAGLSRNSRDFIALGRYLSAHPSAPRTVFALDCRGRGLSDPDPDWRNYRPVVEAQDVIAMATVFGIERAILVGTSRGGIITMLLGALRPALLAGVVLNDIGPVIEGTGLARIKTYLSSRRLVANWDEATAAVRVIAGAQFPGLSDDDWQAFAAAYFTETRAGLMPHFDRNLVRTVVDLDVTEKIPVLWPQFMSLARVPVLAIRGELSDVLSPRTLEAMGTRHPRLEQIIVRSQGHAPLLRDDLTLGRILAFAERCDREGDS